MYLENLKRKPTVIIVVSSFNGMMVGYLAFSRHSLFWSIIFFWMLLFAMIISSRYFSKKMMHLVWQKQLCSDQEKPYRTPIGKMFVLVFLIGLPFYLFWFVISFISALNAYAWVILNLPILTLSFLTFGFVYQTWRRLEGKGWHVWLFHVGIYGVVQLLGWIVRRTVLQAYY